ncbi:MAG: trehalose-phosphatase [Rhodobacteraceae bacterium]|jgi:trehalose 6-phosphate phosphatase|uniref:trehalose-phosphatase n=1 Tax=Marivita sp. TaxID=2003365 RepID=UPI003B5273A5|nr:trehalose-phosphatase [Paracoccaceae bacterium]
MERSDTDFSPRGIVLTDALPDPATIALFLDFDGTLVEIAERPDAVKVLPETQGILRDLNAKTRGRLVIVSGRRLQDLEQFLPEFDGVLVGSHGAERRLGGVHETSSEGQSASFENTSRTLRAWAGNQNEILLEEKPASLVLHYRQAPAMQSECQTIAAELAAVMPGFVARSSKMAVEIMPKAISKERAVLRLMKDWSDRLPIAIGDDRTDEDMFCAADAHGGFGIKVGEGDTVARLRIDNVAAVHALLRRWTNISGASR